MFRLLLIWLLALALPMQGMAAVTMQFCGAGKPSQTETRAQTQAQMADPSASDHAAHATHRHHVDAGDGQAKSAGDAPSTAHAKSKCSACAACCMATALPPAAVLLPAVEPALELTVVAPATYLGPAGTGLERPPKRRLA